MDSLVSVIVPVYNVEAYLRECIDSIINQTYKELEIILVNDGSTDNSLDICEEYAKIDERIIVINRVNGGLSAARNSGTVRATGEFITYIDSDDYIESTLIADLITEAKKSNTEIVISGTTYVWPKHYSREVPSISGRVESDKIIKMCFKQVDGILHTAWGKLYSAKLREELVFPIGRLYEDQFVLYRLILNHICALINNSTYYYRGRDGSILNDCSNLHEKTIDMMESIKCVDDVVSTRVARLQSTYQYKLAADCIVLIRYCLLGSIRNEAWFFAKSKIKTIPIKTLVKERMDINRLIQFVLLKYCMPAYILIFKVRHKHKT